MTASGILFGVGVGPGDPDLITVKAARIVRETGFVAHFAKDGEPGNAWTVARRYCRATSEELRLVYPYTVEIPKQSVAYREAIDAFYDTAAARMAEVLDSGRDVALLCEGDPFFYGSFMYIYDRLADRYPTEVVPGVTAMTACWDHAGVPMTRGDDCLAVVPGTLPEDQLGDRLQNADAVVIMKVGRNLPKIRRVLEQNGRIARALYVERASMENQRIMPLRDMPADKAPYFSTVLLPTERPTS